MAVYFFGCDEGFVKIGRSRNVGLRLQQTNVHAPFEMRLLAVMGDGERERHFHERFRSQHIRGEWFRHEGALKRFLDGVSPPSDISQKKEDAPTPSAGARKLERYLSDRGIKAINFADMIGVDRSSVSRFVSGVRIPRRETMQKIVDATDGAVTANDFFGEAA